MKKYQHRRKIQWISLVLMTGIYSGSVQAEPVSPRVDHQSTHIDQVQYKNGIPEYDNKINSIDFSLHPSVDVRPDPSLQIGPGVIIGPNVYHRGKKVPNPLLKDVLPANHPLLKDH